MGTKKWRGHAHIAPQQWSEHVRCEHIRGCQITIIYRYDDYLWTVRVARGTVNIIAQANAHGK